MKKLSLILLVLLFIQPEAKSNVFLQHQNEIDTIKPLEKAELNCQSIQKNISNAFFITSPVVQDAISGRLSGVRIIPHSSDPGTAFSIISRGRSRLQENDHPLVYINGVPMVFQQHDFGNFLNVINPQDIESIQFLKNGNEIVPYGYNAANGVLLITTKRSTVRKPLSIRFNNSASISQNTNTVDVLNASQYKQAMLDQLPRNADYNNQLGKSNTNWQDQLLQTALGHHHHLSLNGSLGKTFYRVSGGHNKQEGVLKQSDYSRWTGSINLNRDLFNDQLSLGLGFNTSKTDHALGNLDAFAHAILFDPTQSSSFRKNLRSADFISGTNYNPLWTLDHSGNGIDQRNWNLNFKADYKLPFLKGATASLLIGKNKSNDKRKLFNSRESSYSNSRNLYTEDGKNKMNTTIIKVGVDYQTRISEAISQLNVNIGFIKQKDKIDYRKEGANLYFDPSVDSFNGIFPSGDIRSASNTSYSYRTYETNRKTKSIYALMSAELWEKLLVEANFRLDAGDKWDENSKSSSFGLKYKLLQKPGAPVLNSFDIRVGYALLGKSKDETLRNQLNREHSTNFGIDMAFFNKRVTTSLQAYILKHKNLFFFAGHTGVGGNLIRFTRGAKVENKGFEFDLNAIPVSTSNLHWNLQFNLAYNKNKLVQFDTHGQVKIQEINPNLVNSFDNQLNSFYVFPQIYNTDGKPIETQPNERKDKREYKSGEPKFLLGFSSQLKYKKWDAAFTLRANLGNYSYNQAAALYGYERNLPRNIHRSALKTGFKTYQSSSDYYVQNASFLKMENISIGYSIPKLCGKNISARIYVTGQNLFTITGYNGLNPDTPFGIDLHTLPQPRTMAMGIQLDF